MNRWLGRLFGTLLVFLSCGSAARADLMTPWTYSWSRNPISVAADGNGTGGVSMTLVPLAAGANLVGDQSITAVSLSTFSSAPAGTVDTFANSAYSLTLQLTDVASNQSHDFTFNGVFNGSLSQTLSQLTTTFLSPTSQSYAIGQNLYTVTLDSYTPPGVPDATTFGMIGADVTISSLSVSSGGGSVNTQSIVSNGSQNGGDVSVQTVPEPSTLLLASCLLPAAGLAFWRTRAAKYRV